MLAKREESIYVPRALLKLKRADTPTSKEGARGTPYG
jgi:hypothetical protein